MVKIIEHKGKKKTSYYIYDYIKDVVTGKYHKKYIGKGNKEAFLQNLKEKRMKSPYCMKCGKRFEDTIPSYVEKSNFKICNCYK